MKNNMENHERELSKFAEKKGLIDILEQTFSYVQGLKKDLSQDFRKVGQQQRIRNGEYCWKDEAKTIPEMVDKYDYVDLTPDTMDDDVYAKYKACNDIIKALESLV